VVNVLQDFEESENICLFVVGGGNREAFDSSVEVIELGW